MKEELEAAVRALAEKASMCKAIEAQQYTQAALNACNALATLHHLCRIK